MYIMVGVSLSQIK